MSDDKVLPAAQVQAVERWVDERIDTTKKWDNVELLDENGVFTLHRLAASIYAKGWEDGARAEAERNRGARRRASEASS